MDHPIVLYCDRNRISLHAFAVDQLKVAPTTVYRWVRPGRGGRFRFPSPDMMRRVEVATRGAVTVEQLFTAHYGQLEGSSPSGKIRKGEQEKCSGPSGGSP